MLSDAEKHVFRNGGRVGVFFRLGTATPLRLWWGVGDCPVGVNALDQTGAVYAGFGELRGVPAFQQLINGVAERINFQLSGLSPDTVALVSANSANVRGRRVNLGHAAFDPSWALMTPPHWLFHGVADVLSTSRTEADSPSGQALYAIELSVGSMTTGRRRPAFAFYTDQDQRGRSATDRFCERTPNYSQTQKTWPDY